jgi:hypothetical protein
LWSLVYHLVELALHKIQWPNSFNHLRKHYYIQPRTNYTRYQAPQSFYNHHVSSYHMKNWAVWLLYNIETDQNSKKHGHRRDYWQRENSKKNRTYKLIKTARQTATVGAPTQRERERERNRNRRLYAPFRAPIEWVDSFPSFVVFNSLRDEQNKALQFPLRATVSPLIVCDTCRHARKLARRWRPTLWRGQGLAAARKTPYPESLVELRVRYLAASKKARFLRFCEKTWRPSFT